MSNPWWGWLLPLAFGSPWLVGILYYLRGARLRDGPPPPSAAEAARKRLWT